MSNPMTRIHNAITGETIDREMTDDEYAEYLQSIEKNNQARAEMEAKENARQTALNKLIDLGLTEEEVKAFLG